MGLYTEEIKEAATKLGVQVELLTKQEIDLIREQLLERFTDLKTSLEHPAFIGEDSTCDPKAWTWLSEVLKSEPVILFFHSSEDFTGLRIPSGKLMTPLLGDCFAFRFFLTDPQFSFLLWLDDEDGLFYSGEDILRAIRERDNRTRRRSPSKKSCSE